MNAFWKKTLELLPALPFAGLLISTLVTFALLQYRVAGLEKRLDAASPEVIKTKLDNVQKRLNEIRDDVRELRKNQHE